MTNSTLEKSIKTLLNAFLFFTLCTLSFSIHAQSVGVSPSNTFNPQERLHVDGNLRVDSAMMIRPMAPYSPGGVVNIVGPSSTIIISLNPASPQSTSITYSGIPEEGQFLYIFNADNDPASFTGVDVLPNHLSSFVYLSGAWRLAGTAATGADGYIQNQYALDQVADFRITGNGALNSETSTMGIGTESPDAVLEIRRTNNTEASMLLRSDNDAKIELIADTDNNPGAGENDNPYIFMSQDGGNTRAYIGLTGDNPDQSPDQAQPYTGTVGNGLLIGTVDNSALQLGTNNEVHITIDEQGRTGFATNSPDADYLATFSPNNVINSGIRINFPGTGIINNSAEGIAIQVNDNSRIRGLTYINSSSDVTTSFFGTGAELTAGPRVSGFTAFRSGSGKSYGVFGQTGSGGSYAPEANNYAGFFQGRVVISAEDEANSNLGTDLLIRNTALGTNNPVTLALRQSGQLTSTGSVLSTINFGDNFATDVQARIQAIRDAASSGANDLPTALTFSTISDESNALFERMRLNNLGYLGIGNINPATSIDAEGALSLRPGELVNITSGTIASPQIVDVGNRSYLRISSNSADFSNRVFRLSNGLQIGQTLTIEYAVNNNNLAALYDATVAPLSNADLISRAVVFGISNNYSRVQQFVWNGSNWIQSGSGTTGKTIFNHTGNIQQFTVPIGVYSIFIKMWGAGGAGRGNNSNASSGGSGGFVSGELAVTPGEVLTIIVGGGGVNSGGGFGGGGVGNNGAGGGGGRSAIRRESTELATAGGGGGSGDDDGCGSNNDCNSLLGCPNLNSTCRNGFGGAGGGLTGGIGGAGDLTNCPTNCLGDAGRGGTQSAGGIASSSGAGGTGSSGAFLQGGAGGTGGCGVGITTYGGGGGGGGYFGGSGGSASCQQLSNDDTGGGGGGGSSFVANLFGNVSNLQGNSNISGGWAVPPNTADPDFSFDIGYGGASNQNGDNGRVVIIW